MPSQAAPDPEETFVPHIRGSQSFASGRYTVRRVLGGGGQKVVYLVHDEALDRDCALSMVKSELLEPDDLERLRREAQAMARLGAHSNIVTVHDIGDEDGKPYLVCEYVPAGELRRHLRDAAAPLAVERALAIAADVARALAVAHGRGLIHRDVKPANVWLCDDGSAKLGDFGLAFSIDRTRMTMAGTVMGTATYMAPEQARGDPADARTDLYALGVMLYEMVCGRPPFSGDDPLSVISQHASVAPAAPVLHVAGLPTELNDLILRLLAKPPDLRPESAALVLDELRLISESLHTPEEPVEPETEEPENPPAAAGFVGRTPELEQLAASLDRTAAGTGSLVMVVGEPGIGKTRLLEQFAAHARAAGAQVLNGHCYDGDWAPPFSPFVEAIKQHATTASPQRLRAHLGADAGVLARIVPALRERLPNIPEPPAIQAEGERFRLLEAVSDTLGRLAAERPLVLILDDLHWSDKGTIAMLQQVARTSATQRVLVLGAYRDVELDRMHPLASALADLRREKNFERIALRGLDANEVAELLDAIAEQDVPAALSAAIARETDGNPFFIKEVLLYLVEERKIVQQDGTWTSELSIAEMGIPEGVREVIGRRLSRLSDTCNRMLAAASALTGGFTWSVLQAITGDGQPETAARAEGSRPPLPVPSVGRPALPQPQLLDALDEALGAQVLVETAPGAYDFSHALIRHTLYDELSTPRRVLLHQHIGEALESLYAGDLDAHVGELAHHFCFAAGAGAREKALDYAVRAGEAASEARAYEESASWFAIAVRTFQTGERTVDPVRECELMLALGTARASAGDEVGADRSFHAAIDVARSAHLADQFARAVLGIAYEMISDSRVDEERVELLQEAEAMLGADTGTLARVKARLAISHYYATDPNAVLLFSEEALAVARRSGDEGAIAAALVARHAALWKPEHLMERIDVAAELIRIADKSGEHETALDGCGWLVIGLLELSDVDAADARIADYEHRAAVLRRPRAFAQLAIFRAARALMEGRFADGERLSGEAFALSRRADAQNATIVLGILTLTLRREQGRLAELVPAVRVFVDQFPAVPGWRSVLAYVLYEVGAVAEAEQEFLRCAEKNFLNFPHDVNWPVTITLLAEVCAALGDEYRAPMLYEMLTPYASRSVVVGQGTACYGSASRQMGMLAAVMGRRDEARRYFESALEMNTRIRAEPLVARTQYQYAEALLRFNETGDRARAIELLTQASATAAPLGMARIEEQARELQTRARG